MDEGARLGLRGSERKADGAWHNSLYLIAVREVRKLRRWCFHEMLWQEKTQNRRPWKCEETKTCNGYSSEEQNGRGADHDGNCKRE